MTYFIIILICFLVGTISYLLGMITSSHHHITLTKTLTEQVEKNYKEVTEVTIENIDLRNEVQFLRTQLENIANK